MLNERSRKKLEGVDPRIVKVIEEVAKTREILVTEGVRTQAQQDALYAQGRTKPGKIVTWTRNSKHIQGKAVDVVPYAGGKIDWNDRIAFIDLGTEILRVAKEMGVPLRWGYDWDMDGKLMEKGESDGPHFELRE